jgi:hypothetical protein
LVDFFQKLDFKAALNQFLIRGGVFLWVHLFIPVRLRFSACVFAQRPPHTKPHPKPHPEPQAEPQAEPPKPQP